MRKIRKLLLMLMTMLICVTCVSTKVHADDDLTAEDTSSEMVEFVENEECCGKDIHTKI